MGTQKAAAVKAMRRPVARVRTWARAAPMWVALSAAVKARLVAVPVPVLVVALPLVVALLRRARRVQVSRRRGRRWMR